MKKDIKDITKKLETGVQELIESDRYTEFLNTCAKFHRYSATNCLLIAFQMPEATRVAGYKAWQTKFKRQVRKGEKGITILAPCPHKKVVEDEDGNEKEIRWTTFRAVKVFDISQTDGEPLPDICNDLTGEVDTGLIAKLEAVSPVPVGYEKIGGGRHGYFHNADKRIAIAEGLSSMQTAKTLIHEIAHAMMHDKENGTEQEADRMDREVQAESVAYTVCSYLGFDTSEYSFGYIAGWSKGKDAKDICKSLEVIRKTAAEVISAIESEKKLSYVVTEKSEAA